MAATAVMAAGMVVIAENRGGLAKAKVDSLFDLATSTANAMDRAAVVVENGARLDPASAQTALEDLDVPDQTRALIYDGDGLIADSALSGEEVIVSELPFPGETGFGEGLAQAIERAFDRIRGGGGFDGEQLRNTILEDVAQAFATGEPVLGERIAANGDRVARAVAPIVWVETTLGAVVYESRDLEAIIDAERAALVPFIALAGLVTFVSGFGLTVYIARPIRRLAEAARDVRLAGGRRVEMPAMGRRADEIGDLSEALAAMTQALYDRLDAIERFAADVAHEIKNPLTSIRSAAEVLPMAQDPQRRDKLIAVIRQDVARLDRLITDISNASRLDAELAREDLTPIALVPLLEAIAGSFADRAQASGVTIAVEIDGKDAVVAAHEGPLSRVFVNLIENALTFSPEGGGVRVRLVREGLAVKITVEDDGPGIPPDNLETIFERFYTQRPKGAAFGAHSGLGLAIAKQIVEAHGGRIKAENREDETGRTAGARFIVRLPAARTGLGSGSVRAL